MARIFSRSTSRHRLCASGFLLATCARVAAHEVRARAGGSAKTPGGCPRRTPGSGGRRPSVLVTASLRLQSSLANLRRHRLMSEPSVGGTPKRAHAHAYAGYRVRKKGPRRQATCRCARRGASALDRAAGTRGDLGSSADARRAAAGALVGVRRAEPERIAPTRGTPRLRGVTDNGAYRIDGICVACRIWRALVPASRATNRGPQLCCSWSFLLRGSPKALPRDPRRPGRDGVSYSACNNREAS